MFGYSKTRDHSRKGNSRVTVLPTGVNYEYVANTLREPIKPPAVV